MYMSKPLLNRDARGERSYMARYDFMIKESNFVKTEQIEIREKEKQEVLKILRQLKLLCLKPLGKDDYIKSPSRQETEHGKKENRPKSN